MASWLNQITRSEGRSQRSSITTMFDADAETILLDFDTYVREGFKGSSPIFSLIAARALTLSDVEFAYQTLERPRELSLGPETLRRPWPNGTTRALVARIDVDVSLAGNAFVRRVQDRRIRLRPDWVDILVGVPADPVLAMAGVTDLLGYMYWPGGLRHSGDGIPIAVRDMAHIAPIPDPSAAYRGVSWVAAASREADSDILMTKHKGKFFTNAATPTLAVVTEQSLTTEQRNLLKEQFERKHASWENAYKTVYLEGGADLKVVGNTIKQMDFSVTQSAGEVRLAAAAGVPPVVVGFLQGIQASTYSNYA